MSTNLPAGHPLARKAFSVAAFAETQRKPSFRRNLTGPAPTQAQAESKLKGQTTADMPFVRVTDLTKGGGDTVSVDLFNIIKGKPVMGDRKIAGKMMGLTFSSMDIRLDQYRAGVDSGGRMAQQRTLHRLRSIAKSNLAGYGARLEDQLCLVHVGGARGYDDGEDWAVPLADDPAFSEIMVNDVLPPTINRRFFGGDADSVDALANTDVLTLDDIDRIRAEIDDMVFPPQPIRIEGDPAADEEPLYCMYVTGRQWHSLQTATGAQSWRTFLQNAHNRGSMFKHPLFMGSPGMWNGIVIKKMNRGIRFPTGSLVAEYQANGSISQVPAAVDTDRAIVLGAQALGEVYGAHGKSGYHANWHEEWTDHQNVLECSLAFMAGKSKIRFQNGAGEWTDHGVMTLDTYAPAPSA